MDVNVQPFIDTVPTRFWQKLDDGRVECKLCPRSCKLRSGQRGLCFVRANQNDSIVLTTYGRSSGFAVDPVEKKPLNHYLPGTPILSFGTAGCNLACKFCQNWDISKSREMDSLMDRALPETIAHVAQQLECSSVAFTYNDPVIFHEYAIDVAQACKARDIGSVAVTAGYVCSEPRVEFYRHMDAANVDLKAFTQQFYRKVTGGHLDAVLETLEYIKRETEVWLEITTLLIPGQNDSEYEIQGMTQWIVEHLGVDIPVHFTAFHPDWKMTDIASTPPGSLLKARQIALNNGIRYVYVGNVHNKQAGSTYCHRCEHLLIGRDWYQLSEWNLNQDGCCNSCGTPCSGVFERLPGTWGAKRMAVNMQELR